MLLASDSLLADNAAVAAHAVTQVVTSQSDDTETKQPWGGSKRGQAPNADRDFVGAYQKLVHYYFSGNDSLYNEAIFERRFRMKREIRLLRNWLGGRRHNGNHCRHHLVHHHLIGRQLSGKFALRCLAVN